MHTPYLVQEREIWDVLEEAEFNRLMSLCRERYGEPVLHSRLALQVTDFHRADLDTRIRITDGTPVLMQKWGDWNDERRGENELALPNDAVFIARLYRMLGKMLDSDNVQWTVIQLENSLFSGEGIEVKLTRHLGKELLYSFEIEAMDEAADAVTFARRFGLNPDLSYKDEAYWRAFNARANRSAADMPDGELAELLRGALSR